MNAKHLFEKAEKLRSEEKGDKAVSFYQQAREKSGDDKWLVAESAHMIGVIHYQQKKFGEANKILERAKEEFEKVDDADMVGAVLRDLGLVAYEQKDYQKAKDLLEKSIQTLLRSTKKGHLGISQVKLGMVEKELGDLQRAEDLVWQGVTSISLSEDRFFESIAYYNLAQIQKELGKIEEAKSSLQRSKEILDKIAGPEEHKNRREKMAKFLEDLEKNP